MEWAIGDWAERQGFAVAWGPAGLLDVVRDDLDERERRGEIESTFAGDNLSFEYGEPPDGWRVLMVVMPRPATWSTLLSRGVASTRCFPQPTSGTGGRSRT